MVIGSLNMDMVLHTEIPRVGETLLGRLNAYVPGGKGANQAYAGARLGASTAMLGKVGQDAFGDTLVEALRTAGVDTTLIARAEQQTGLAVICVNAAGDNSIVVLPGANEASDTAFIQANEAAIADSRVVLLQMEIPYPAVYEAIRIAKAHDRLVILNPAPAPDSLPDEVLRQMDYLTPNETELARLSGLPVTDRQSAAAAAQVLLARGVRGVLATLGSSGALLCTSASQRFFPAYRVEAVDTTAAGDTFSAAFATELARHGDADCAIRFATAAAAISVTRSGAQTSIPDRVEVEQWMKEVQTA